MKKALIEEPDIFKIHADFCKMFCNEKRLHILWKLYDKECSVSELANDLDIPVPNVSQHLRIMKDKGALHERKEGHMVYYRVANDKFVKGSKLIREAILEILQAKSKVLN